MPSTPIPARYPTAAVTERLTGLLHLRSHGQDFDIEAADAARVGEFLDAYEGQPLNEDERFALMELIVASYDESVSAGGSDDGRWQRIRGHLLGRFDLHGYTVQYWSSPDDEDAEAADNGFAITGRMREVMTVVYGPRERWPRRPYCIMRFIDWPAAQAESGMRMDALDISDERDGTFELSWSKYRDRPYGTERFASAADAVAYALGQFGVAPDRWSTL